MTPHPHVVGVGDADIDLFLELPRLPSYDEKLSPTAVHRVPGGMVANTLVALARLGTPTTFVGCVGDDDDGRRIAENLGREGVGLAGLRVVPGQRTYFCIILLDASGEKTLLCVPEPTMYPPLEQVTPALLRLGTHVHTTSFATVAPSVIRRAYDLGLTVSVDLDAAPGGLDAYRAHLPCVQVLLMNDQGRQSLCPDLAVDAAVRHLLGCGVGCVVMTQGGAGAVAGTRDAILRTTAWSVAVRDTTGGGDSFAGAFLHGYLRGWPLAACLRFANAAAALAVQAIGGQTGAPSLAAVEGLLASGACPPIEAI